MTSKWDLAPSGFRRFKVIPMMTTREILEAMVCENPYKKLKDLEKTLVPANFAHYVNGAFDNPRIEANFQALKVAREAILCVVGVNGYHSATAQDIATALDVLF